MTRRTTFTRDERAAAMVEFAIVLPLLLLLVFGIIEFAAGLYTLHHLTNAVRDGARYGASRALDLAASEQAIKDRVQANIVNTMGSDLTPVVEVLYDAPPPDTDRITVRIANYQYEPITPLPALAGLGAFTFSPTAVFRWEGAD